MVTTWLFVLRNAYVGILCGGRVGVTKGCSTDHFLADKKRMDVLVTSSCVVELSMDSVLEPSSRERKIMAMHKIVSTK